MLKSTSHKVRRHSGIISQTHAVASISILTNCRRNDRFAYTLFLRRPRLSAKKGLGPYFPTFFERKCLKLLPLDIELVAFYHFRIITSKCHLHMAKQAFFTRFCTLFKLVSLSSRQGKISNLTRCVGLHDVSCLKSSHEIIPNQTFFVHFLLLFKVCKNSRMSYGLSELFTI